MADFGLSDSGFKVKRLADIREAVKRRLLQIKDPDTGESLQVDFNEDDPIIQIVNAICDEISTLWALQGVTYRQFNPNAATGPALSALVQLNGLVRKNGNPSIVSLKFAGSPGVLIPKGTRATDADNKVIWLTQKQTTIGADSETVVLASSQTNGAFNYAQGTINTLLDQLVNVSSVVNPSASIPGQPDETDESLRVRRARSTATPSQGIAEAIYGAVSNLPGVDYVKIFTNRTMTTDARGIDPKSIAVVVRGGDDQEIAKQIFLRASLGESFFGTTSVTFTDSLQQSTIVQFSRPVDVPIDVEVTVADIEGSPLPYDYADKIKNNIIAFAAQGPEAIGISNINQFDQFGFPPSEDIVVSRLYTPVNAVKGVKIVSLKIAKHGETLGTDDVVINWNEVGLFTGDNIQVLKQ